MIDESKLNQLKYKKQFLAVRIISEFLIEVENNINEEQATTNFIDGLYNNKEFLPTGNEWLESASLQIQYSSFGSDSEINPCWNSKDDSPRD